MKKMVDAIMFPVLAVFMVFISSAITLPILDETSYFFHTLGSHKEEKVYVMNGILKKATELDRDAYGFDLSMFPKDQRVCYIEISKYDDGEELVWGWHTALSELPKTYIGKPITLKYNFIRNWLGNKVSVRGRDVPGIFRMDTGIPIYGEIATSTTTFN